MPDSESDTDTGYSDSGLETDSETETESIASFPDNNSEDNSQLDSDTEHDTTPSPTGDIDEDFAPTEDSSSEEDPDADNPQNWGKGDTVCVKNRYFTKLMILEPSIRDDTPGFLCLTADRYFSRHDSTDLVRIKKSDFEFTDFVFNVDDRVQMILGFFIDGVESIGTVKEVHNSDKSCSVQFDDKDRPSQMLTCLLRKLG
ncbi:MAG: hypothetical protein MHMPM18_001358 [Marteilia pararefringens]